MNEKNNIMKFDEMVNGLFKFYKEGIKPTNKKKYSYNGLDVTSPHILATTLPIKNELSEEEFKKSIKNGLDPIQILLGCAIRLGIQQGINLCINKPMIYLDDEITIQYLKMWIDIKKFQEKELKKKGK